MMKQKKGLSLFLALALSLSALAGCEASDTASDTSEAQQSVNSEDTESTSDTTEEAADENEAAAVQLLNDLTGTYQELWPVILADEYDQIWLNNCTELVGEENSEAAYEMLASMVTSEIYGEEAAEAYADGSYAYDCAFIQGMKTIEFDGSTQTIKGYDADGNELFSHTYHYVGMEEMRGLYEYESDDADSGEFTYFCLAPDTSDTTYHIEFRYGSDLEALGKYDAGAYAYWLASGISTECDQAMIESCIKLFCTENLSE